MWIKMSIERLNGCKVKLYLAVSLVLLLYCCRHVKGVVEISLSEVAPVCQAGDQLGLTCSVTGRFLRWEFTVRLENGAPMTIMPILSSGGSSGVPPPVMVNSTTFTFSRPSTQPLSSMMTINSVSEGLNGVQVRCVDIEPTESAATTTIRIIGAGDIPRVNLSIRSYSEQFASDEITVLLEWTVSVSQIYYQHLLQNVSILVVPDLVVTISNRRNMSVQLTLQYNTLYSVSVTQPGICGRPNQTEFIHLNYSKCSDPMALTQNNVSIVGYEDPALQGEIVTFTCLSGLELSGPISAMCMENGEWEPDPGEVNCTEITTDSNVITTIHIMPNKNSTSITNSFDGDSNEAIQLSLGIVFGVLAVVLVVIVVVVLAMFLKHKGFPKHRIRRLDSGYAQNFTVECEALGDSNNHSHKVEETLVYADIGPASFPKQQRTPKSTLLDLDDSRVEYALLNHSVHEDKVSTLKVSTMVKKDIDSNNCPPVNLDNLLIQLRPQVGPKWYQFGEAAGIEKEVLDRFSEQCSPDECIVELFDYWLRVSTEVPTWKTVADILKAINLTELGLAIDKVYTTGMLPIEVDMNRIPQLDLQEEEEPPPPLPIRSTNLHTDTSSHTLDSGSQDSKPTARAAALLPPYPSNETPAPALPPKPAYMKLVGI